LRSCWPNLKDCKGKRKIKKKKKGEYSVKGIADEQKYIKSTKKEEG